VFNTTTSTVFNTSTTTTTVFTTSTVYSTVFNTSFDTITTWYVPSTKSNQPGTRVNHPRS
jgi:hypothetical protein